MKNIIKCPTSEKSCKPHGWPAGRPMKVVKEISRQFVINVFDDNLSLSYFKQSNQTVEDFFKMYNVEIRELDENETIYTV